MNRKIVIAILVVLAVVGSLAGVKFLQIHALVEAGKHAVMPAETVSSAVVHEEKWQNTMNAIGSVVAVQGVTVTPEIEGTVSEIAFESGALVQKGDLLVRLDTSLEDAQLRATVAQADLARLNADRSRKLFADKTISQADLDTAEATLKQTLADADAIRATIGKKTLRAPFAGRLGIRLVNLGEYLDKGKAIVSLQSLAPIYVEFSLPQQELAQLSKGLRVRVSIDAYPDKKFEGELSAINPDLDPNTRSVRLQATLANADQLLRPGMFARVEVLLPVEQTVLAVPATAVLSSPFGDSVYVIEPTTNSPPGLIVRQQFIRTGRARGDFVSVETGLKAGEKIASAGIFKLRNQMPVVENNQLAPKPSTTPKPADT